MPGHKYSLQVPEDDWPASGQTSHTTMARGTPATSQTHTPVQPTSSLPAAIPSVSTGDTLAISSPPGFLILPEDPIKHQAVLWEQIRADGKTLGKASRVLCNGFHHMGKFHSKQMKAMQECQLVGIRNLKAQVTQALSDWRVDLSSCQHLLGMVPSTSLYNSVVVDLRTKTYEMAYKVKQVEVAYVESKKGTLKALEKLKKETLDKLETLSDSAIDRFMDEMATAIYECFSTSMEAVPFMALAAGIVANFHSITFALALQSADLPLDTEVELDLFTTLAHVIPSLCPLGTTTTLPRPDQLQGDLVGAKEVPAPDNVETDREKAMSSTSNEGATQVSWVPSTFSKSRSATLAFSCEASPSPAKAQVATKGATMTNTFCSNVTTRTIPQYVPPLLSRHRDAEGLKHLQDIFRQHAAPSATGSAPSTADPVDGQCTSLQGTPTKRQKMSITPCPRDPKTQQVVKTLVASTGYELASGSTLHQVHNVTAQDDPEVIQEPDEDVNVGEDDNVDDDIPYLGTSQLGELQAGTDTTPVLKSKKKKSTKPKTEDKAKEATLRERRKADHEMAHHILYAEDFLAIQALRLHLNLPRASDPNMDMSSELEFMDQEWRKTHPDSFFHTHIYTVEEVTKHLEECAGNVKKYSATEHGQYQAALTTLATQSMWVPFPKPSKVPGTRDILIT